MNNDIKQLIENIVSGNSAYFGKGDNIGTNGISYKVGDETDKLLQSNATPTELKNILAKSDNINTKMAAVSHRNADESVLLKAVENDYGDDLKVATHVFHPSNAHKATNKVVAYAISSLMPQLHTLAMAHPKATANDLARAMMHDHYPIRAAALAQVKKTGNLEALLKYAEQSIRN